MTDVIKLRLTPKQRALSAAANIQPAATGLVEFRSEGRLAIIGKPDAVNAAVKVLDGSLRAHCLYIEKPKAGPDDPQATQHTAQRDSLQLTGHLGAFDLGGANATQPITRFDLILDLCEKPLFSMAQKPLGYFAPGDDAQALSEALHALPELVGRFEKPQFFDYDPGICAHGASGVAGCRQCIDACPTAAIVSIGEKVQVDPNLCQGGGICTAVCPTGAMTYRYPTAQDTLTRLRSLISAYIEAAEGKRPVLVLHGQEAELPELAEDELPVGLEELAGVGVEIWLSALSYGARALRLLSDKQIATATRAALERQRLMTNQILSGLGYPAVITWYDASSTNTNSAISTLTHLPQATFASGEGKRQTWFMAIDHLAESADTVPEQIKLPSTAPLGNIQVNKDSCTLCLACTSVCPAKALADGGDKPALRFFEANCVQCGLCASACPEHAINLEPRLLLDPQARRSARVLNEEEPFCCISCGKAFATRSVIEKMQVSLAGHHMFKDEASKLRLQMCEDCRVADMVRSGAMDKIV